MCSCHTWEVQLWGSKRAIIHGILREVRDQALADMRETASTGNPAVFTFASRRTNVILSIREDWTFRLAGLKQRGSLSNGGTFVEIGLAEMALIRPITTTVLKGQKD